jgi:hypothetical protein
MIDVNKVVQELIKKNELLNQTNEAVITSGDYFIYIKKRNVIDVNLKGDLVECSNTETT